MPSKKGSRAERRAVREQLVAAGILSPLPGGSADEHRLELAADILRQEIPAHRRTKVVPEEEHEAVKARLVAMKGQLAAESQRARIAEAAREKALRDASLSEQERQQLRRQLTDLRATRRRLEEEVAALVDHERVLLEFTTATRELRADMASQFVELRTRVGELEKQAEVRRLGDLHERERRDLKRKRIRRAAGVCSWVASAVAIIFGTLGALGSEPWLWTSFFGGSFLGVAAGALLLFGRRSAAETAGWIFLALELLLYVARPILGGH